MIPSIRLNSGAEMPVLGLGTWQLTGKKCGEAVRKALEIGYTHLDTAQIYGNQAEIGKAIADADRKKLFITSKIWHSDLAAKRVPGACEKILEELNTDYVDLLLIHWPNRGIPIGETLAAMNDLVEQKKARSIGVANFTVAHLKEALETGVLFGVNQVEFHPGLFQKELLDFCRKNGLALTAYSPLARNTLLKNTLVQSIGQKNRRTPAQVCLRWSIQKGAVVIPKTGGAERLRENMQVFDWVLSPEDEQQLDALGQKNRLLKPFFISDFGE